jgi:glycosyltransferase involved in cell wall biosynthesis
LSVALSLLGMVSLHPASVEATGSAEASEFRLSIILPAMDETWSLRETIEQIEQTNHGDVLEYLIVICADTTAECRGTVEELVKELPYRVFVIEQCLPFVGGAVRDAFKVARGSHVAMMGSDLETDPATLPLMVAEAKCHLTSIITATRLKGGLRFEGYNSLKLLLNRVFQAFFAKLYNVQLTDLTFAYRILPTELVRSIRWEELKHPFLFETIVKPLRLGIGVIEVPSRWQARREGRTHNSFLRNFLYFRVGLKTRFRSRLSLLAPSR